MVVSSLWSVIYFIGCDTIPHRLPAGANRYRAVIISAVALNVICDF